MFPLVGLCLVAPWLVFAPVPKESPAEKLQRIYGQPEDPDKVCQFALQGLNLRVTAAAGLRGLNPGRNLINAPRTLKPIEGDFRATLRLMRDKVTDGADRADEIYTPSGGGGLILWHDEYTHLRLSRSQWIGENGGEPRTTYNLRGSLEKAELVTQQQNTDKAQHDPVTFRLQREGNKFSASYSADGKRWTDFDTVEVAYPRILYIGVYVAHNFNKPLVVEFEPLSIEMPDPRGAKP